jgi:dipeptidyl aminopeptidase/acylaminoacyl peptidase
LTALAWSADSSAVLVASLVRTATRLERLPLQGTPSYLPFHGRVISSGLATDAASRRLAFTSSTDRSPEEVTVLDPASAAPVVVTELNPQVAGWRLATTRVVAWKNSEGVALEGVLWVAPGAGPGKPAPLVVLPHGGPDWLTNVRFDGLAHYLASRGYSVFGPNYRGSVGYGFAFYEANRGRFGEIEQADVESGVDQLVADGLADARRLYFGGWSWGGYVTVWTIAHVQRYRAAVAGAAVSDTLHSYSLSDINHGVAAEWEFRGDPWNQPEAFDKPSPIRAVKGIRTPLLILHGDADGRVPWAESVQLWRALTDLGREVEFWSYPREDHMFAEPAHRVDFLKRWGDWYDAH